MQSWICILGIHSIWVDPDSVECKVFLTLLHLTSNENQTLDLLTLSPVPSPLGFVLDHVLLNLSCDVLQVFGTMEQSTDGSERLLCATILRDLGSLDLAEMDRAIDVQRQFLSNRQTEKHTGLQT